MGRAVARKADDERDNTMPLDAAAAFATLAENDESLQDSFLHAWSCRNNENGRPQALN